ncbi:2-oxoacid:ferredoxin oxidoreductase subunit beta [Candidatus Dojkabacteria bacterium]|nr:2-oxoacid:ferredoxin oxidoreductase subunit beta [Candidatus Dojkabacteria bacterium]
MQANTNVKINDYASPVKPTWCAGCGDFAIWTAIKMALVELNIPPTEVVLCFDIGCNSNMADKINAYVFKGLHGRVIPVAAGIKLANQGLPVIAVGGDGGTFDEGMQHFVHAFRSNYDITLILHNNCDFGLTTGQATPTTPTGQKMNSSPFGVAEDRLNPTQLALTLNPSFVAKGFTGDLKQLVGLLKAAIEHKGFSYLEVLQHCPTYNQFMDQAWYKDRVYKVEENDTYDNTNLKLAYERAGDQLEKIATGILYQNKEKLNFYQRINHIKDQPDLVSNVEKKDISELLLEFK